MDSPIWPLFKGKRTQKSVEHFNAFTAMIIFISERKTQSFIAFCAASLCSSMIICSMTNVLSLRIMCGGYSFHLHFTILTFFVWFNFCRCTVTKKSEFPDESKQFTKILDFFAVLSIKRCKTPFNTLYFHIVYWNFSATKNKVPAGGCHSHPGGH